MCFHASGRDVIKSRDCHDNVYHYRTSGRGEMELKLGAAFQDTYKLIPLDMQYPANPQPFPNQFPVTLMSAVRSIHFFLASPIHAQSVPNLNFCSLDNNGQLVVSHSHGPQYFWILFRGI